LPGQKLQIPEDQSTAVKSALNNFRSSLYVPVSYILQCWPLKSSKVPWVPFIYAGLVRFPSRRLLIFSSQHCCVVFRKSLIDLTWQYRLVETGYD